MINRSEVDPTNIYANSFHDLLLQEAFGGSLGPNGMLWTTYSDIGLWRYGIIFSAALQSGYDLHPDDAGFGHQVCIITYYLIWNVHVLRIM